MGLNSLMLLALINGLALLAIAIIIVRRSTEERPMLLFELAGRVILYGAPAAGILAVLGLAALGSWNLLQLGSYLAVPMIVGPLVYMWYGRKAPRPGSLDDRAFKLLLVQFLVGFAASVALLTISEVRPYAYYMLIAVIATIVLLEVVLFEGPQRNAKVILLQVSMLVLNIIWGINLKYDYYVGRSDILNHAWYAQIIVDKGFITKEFFDYIPFPLWHILSGATYMISGAASAMHDFMFLLIGLIYVLIPLAIYLIAKRTTKDAGIALLAALFTAVYPFFILTGSEALARSVVSLLGIVLLLLLVSGSRSRARFALALLLTAGIIVFHTVGIMFVLLILAITYVAQLIFVTDEKYRFLSLKYFVAALALVAVYWTLFASRLIDTLLWDVNYLGPGVTAGTMTSIMRTPLNELFNYLQFVPLLFFIVIGIVYLLRSKDVGRTAKLCGITALVLIPLTFPGPGTLLSTLAANIEIERFFENGFLFVGLAAGAGFAALFLRTGRLARTALVALFAVMVLLAVSNDFVATDNPLVKRPFYTHDLTNQELSGLMRLATMAPGSVSTDFIYYKALYNSQYQFKSLMVQVSDQSLQFLKSDASEMVVIRNSELEKRPLFVASVNGTQYDYVATLHNIAYYYKDSPLWGTLDKSDRIGDAGGFKVYL